MVSFWTYHKIYKVKSISWGSNPRSKYFLCLPTDGIDLLYPWSMPKDPHRGHLLRAQCILCYSSVWHSAAQYILLNFWNLYSLGLEPFILCIPHYIAVHISTPASVGSSSSYHRTLDQLHFRLKCWYFKNSLIKLHNE